MTDVPDNLEAGSARVLSGVIVAGALALVGTLSLTAAQLANQDGRVDLLPGDARRAWYAWTGAGLLVLAFILALPAQSRLARIAVANRQLRRIVEEQNARELSACRISTDLLAIKLEEIASALGLLSGERISFFLDSPGHDGLVLAARHSVTQTFKSAGRRRYPYFEGCIGSAWDTGGTTACTIQANPGDDLDGWSHEIAEKAGIPPATARAMHMKSRTCIARRIEGPPGGSPRGLIVIESTSAITDQFVGGSVPAHLNPQELERYVLNNMRTLERLLELAGDLRVAVGPDH